MPREWSDIALSALPILVRWMLDELGALPLHPRVKLGSLVLGTQYKHLRSCKPLPKK